MGIACAVLNHMYVCIYTTYMHTLYMHGHSILESPKNRRKPIYAIWFQIEDNKTHILDFQWKRIHNSHTHTLTVCCARAIEWLKKLEMQRKSNQITIGISAAAGASLCTQRWWTSKECFENKTKEMNKIWREK